MAAVVERDVVVDREAPGDVIHLLIALAQVGHGLQGVGIGIAGLAAHKRRNVADAVHRDPVHDTPLGSNAAESARMTVDPVAHEAAVTAAGAAQICPVDIRVCIQHMVDESHNLFVIDSAPLHIKESEFISFAV